MAIVLLFSFLGVQLISIGCTITNFYHQFSHRFVTESSHHEHDHHHKHRNDHSTTNDQDKSCCVENATVFLQGLEAISQELNYVFNSTNLLATVRKEQTPPIAVAKNILFAEIRPPPKHPLCGLIKRILFQSFQL